MTTRTHSTVVAAAITLLLAAGSCSSPPNAAPAPATHGTAYSNGHWFDGTQFRSRTMYVVGSSFATRRPVRVDTTIDLGGGFVVPPFGDAHYHLTDPRIAAATFLRDGIFYVKDQSNAPAGR